MKMKCSQHVASESRRNKKCDYDWIRPVELPDICRISDKRFPVKAQSKTSDNHGYFAIILDSLMESLV